MRDVAGQYRRFAERECKGYSPAYLATLQTLVADVRAGDPSVESITRAVIPHLKARFGSWEGFEWLAPLNIAQMADELSGRKSVPQPLK